MGMDDPVLAMLRYAPFLFVIAGVGLVIWLSRQRLPFELQPDILAALSHTEALPASTIRQRPPLAYQERRHQDAGLSPRAHVQRRIGP